MWSNQISLFSQYFLEGSLQLALNEVAESKSDDKKKKKKKNPGKMKLVWIELTTFSSRHLEISVCLN